MTQEQVTAYPVARSSSVAFVLEARRRLKHACFFSDETSHFQAEIGEIRHLIAAACSLSEEVALATALLQPQGRYSIRHSVDVAVLCQVVGSKMRLAEAELTSVVSAALTMNISMLDVQDRLQEQREPLSEVQRELVQAHPAASEGLLRRIGVQDELWLQAVLCHHEAADGSGYGRTVQASPEVPLLPELISLADVYCARTSNRIYRSAVGPSTVLKTLFKAEGTKVRSGLASQFIKALGVFPPGTPVLLQNGEIAVVTGRGTKPANPDVCAVLNAEGMPRLLPTKRDTGKPQFSVCKVLEWSALGKPPSMESLWGKVAALP